MLQQNVQVVLGNANYVCQVNDGTHQWIIDEPVSKGGNDLGTNPFAALLASLGSCSAITIKMYAQRKGWDVQKIEISLNLSHTLIADKKVNVFMRDITIDGNLTEEQISRLKEIVKACPVSKVLEGNIEIITTLTKSDAIKL